MLLNVCIYNIYRASVSPGFQASCHNISEPKLTCTSMRIGKPQRMNLGNVCKVLEIGAPYVYKACRPVWVLTCSRGSAWAHYSIVTAAHFLCKCIHSNGCSMLLFFLLIRHWKIIRVSCNFKVVQTSGRQHRLPSFLA
jgi:hypothetical protein